ncbi:oligosaccharide flippase family protein [Telluribacter humicola]|uniref:oligosaccharide flippase family protein n=1 Tax=Telluribacter humicola TaxID=1720261 RepID=UPI001A95AD41|nr:oligosaccharide flippase family protein [Telluribacter humicola]
MLSKIILNFSGHSARMLTTLLATPLLIKFLGIEIYGLWNWSTSMVAIVQLAEGGLSTGVLYFLSKSDSKEEKNCIITSTILLICISAVLVTTIILLSAPFLKSSIKGITLSQWIEIEYIYKLGILVVIQRIIQSFLWAVLQSKQQYKFYNIIITGQLIIQNLIWLILGKNGILYLPYYTYTSIAVNIVSIIILFVYTWDEFKYFKWHLKKETIKEFLNYNKSIVGSSLGSAFFAHGDKLLIAEVLGPNTLGVYVIFTNINIQLNQLIAQAIHPIFPLVSSTLTTTISNLNSLKQSIYKLYSINIFLSIIGSATLMTFAEYILKYFLKDYYNIDYLYPFYIMNIIYGIYTLAVTGHYILLGKGKSRKVMKLTLLCGILSLISIYILCTNYGLYGAVLGNFVYVFILKLLLDGMSLLYTEETQWLGLLLKAALLFLIYALIIFSFNTSLINTLISFSIFISSISFLLFPKILNIQQIHEKYFKKYNK